MKTRNQNKQETPKKLITIQKLKFNELLKIKGGDGDPRDNDFD